MKDSNKDNIEQAILRIPKSTHEAFKLFASENNLKLNEAANRVLTKSINSDDLLKKNQPIKLVEKVSENTKAVKDLDKMFRSWMQTHERNEIKVLREDLKVILSTMRNYPNAESFRQILQKEVDKIDSASLKMDRSADFIKEQMELIREENRQSKSSNDLFRLLMYGFMGCVTISVVMTLLKQYDVF